VGKTSGKNLIRIFVNRTPVAAESKLQRDKTDIDVFGCGLGHTLATAPKRQNFIVCLNVISPYVSITSDGKEPNLLPFFSPITSAIKKAVRKVSRPGPGAVSQKSVVLDHLDEVIETVSGGTLRYRFNERQLFYALRPIVMAETGSELQIKNFTSIITDYEAEHGEIELMYREPRGSITHPHSGDRIRSSSASVTISPARPPVQPSRLATNSLTG
jgi:hypothetical protein